MHRLTLLLALLAILFAGPAFAGEGTQIKNNEIKNNDLSHDCNGLLNCNDVDISDNNLVGGLGNVVGNTTTIKDNDVALGGSIVKDNDVDFNEGAITVEGGKGGKVDFGKKNGFGVIEEGAVSDVGNLTISPDAIKIEDGDVTDDSEVNVDASDHSVQSIDNDFPVNTAAPVFAGNCSQGVSAQTMSFGGSIASGNPVCDYIAVSGAYIAGGDREAAFKVLEKAEDAADWRAVFAKIRMCLTLGLL